MVVYDDLTIEVALADPMIDLVRRADGIDRRDFATLLKSAAHAMASTRQVRAEALARGRVPVPAAIAATGRSRGCGCAW